MINQINQRSTGTGTGGLASSLLTNGFQKDLHPGEIRDQTWPKCDQTRWSSEIFRKIEWDCCVMSCWKKMILRSKPNDNRNVQEEHTHLARCVGKARSKAGNDWCECMQNAVSNMADLPRRGTSVRPKSGRKISLLGPSVFVDLRCRRRARPNPCKSSP